jgi:hypothetical protein
MPGKSKSDIGIFAGNLLHQSGTIGIPVSGPARYRWLRIIPALPRFGIF